MKNLFLIIFLTFFNIASAQKKIDPSTIISKAELIGTWQRDSKIVGSGLNQNFIFYKNGRFVLNVGSDRDDAAEIIALKGTYRLDNGQLYFTIISKTVIEGKLEVGDPMITMGIFQFAADSKIKEVKEPNPTELDPCYITMITRFEIKISNEVYYKVKQ